MRISTSPVYLFIGGRVVVFCWYFLLLGNLRGFVGRFKINIYQTVILSASRGTLLFLNDVYPKK